jgi:hypothetical protein
MARGSPLLIAVALALSPLVAVAAYPIQDFESGSLPGSCTQDFFNGTTATASGPGAHRGSFGLRVVDTNSPPNGTGTEYQLVCAISPAVNGAFYLRVWLKLSGINNQGTFEAIQILSATFPNGDSVVSAVEVTPTGSNGSFRMREAGTNPGSGVSQGGYGSTFASGSWNLIEVWVDRMGQSNGSVRFYVNGTQQTQRTGLNFNGHTISSVKLGEPFSSDLDFAGTIDFDDLRTGNTPPASRVAVSLPGGSAVPVGQCVDLSISVISSFTGAAVAAPFDAPLTAVPGGAGGTVHQTNSCGSALGLLSTGSTGMTGGYLAGAVGPATLQLISTDFLDSSTLNLTQYSPPTQLAFLTAADSQGGSEIPSILVEVRDAANGRVVQSSAQVTLQLETNPTGESFSDRTVSASAGVASFTNVVINRAGTYRWRAISAGLTSALSPFFTVSVGAPTRFAFSTQPGNSAAGQPIAGPPTVVVQDPGGNTVTSVDGAQVTLSLSPGSPAGTLSGTTLRTTSNGVVAFPSLSINLAGSGYALRATGFFTTATSATFSIGAGPAGSLAFVAQPVDRSSAQTLPPVTVEIRDAAGNRVTGANDAITVAFEPGTANGATLAGTTTRSAASGLATFDDLSIARSGGSYRLRASATGLGTATSSAFAIAAGPVTQLAFTTQPANGTAAQSLGAVAVTVRDAAGNTVTSFNGPVAIALGANPGGSTLAGTLSVNASSGVASFSGLTLNRAGPGYTLSASINSGVVTATSSPFDIAVGPAAGLRFFVQPASSTVSTLPMAAIEVEVIDAGGNRVNSSAPITLAIETNAGGGTLSGAGTANAAAGLAQITGLSINRAGVGYTLRATSPGLSPVTSAPFSITVGSAVGLRYSVQPADGVALQPVPPVAVEVIDAGGNRVTSASATVQLVLLSGQPGAQLGGTSSLATVNGVATFSNLTVDRVRTGYSFHASAPGLGNALSTTFNISAGAPTRLVFGAHPATAPAAQSLGAITVRAEDAGGNLATGSSAAISLTLQGGTAGATLSGARTVNALNGVATFSGLTVDRVGTGYRLSADASGLTSALSNVFDVTAGAAARLSFVVQPIDGSAGQPLAAIEVAVEDAGGNRVLLASDAISLELLANPGNSALTGTATVAAVSGVARFVGLQLDRSGAGYTLRATAGALLPAVSTPFAIGVGPPVALGFVTPPTDGEEGRPLALVEVGVFDVGGNLVTAGSPQISLALADNPAGAQLAGSTAALGVAGVARFPASRVDRSGSGFAMVASAIGLTSAISGPIRISAFRARPPQSGSCGAPYLHALESPEGALQPLAWELASGPAGMTLSDGQLSWVPTNRQEGSQPFELKHPSGELQRHTVDVSCFAPPLAVQCGCSQAGAPLLWSAGLITLALHRRRRR